LRDLTELQERIKLLQEEIAAQVGEQTNKSVFTLTVVIVVLAVTVLAGWLAFRKKD
jgi:zinc transporter